MRRMWMNMINVVCGTYHDIAIQLPQALHAFAAAWPF
jgi:hypothetical protein